VRLAEDLPATEVDAAVVELCLSNYISNAIKYSNAARSSRWVAVRAQIVDAPPLPSLHASDRPRHELVVEVHDNGIGVPEAARDRLFERFYRAHTDTASGIEGTGLGLSLVRETVELRGGRAWAEFGPDGSCFAFSLPLEQERVPKVEEARLTSDGVSISV